MFAIRWLPISCFLHLYPYNLIGSTIIPGIKKPGLMSVAIGSSSQALSMYCVFIWSPANLVWLRWGEQTAHLKSILRKCFRLCCSWPRIIVHTHYVSDVLFFSMTVHHNNWYFVRLYQILLSLSSRTGFCVCPKGGGQIWEKQLKSTSYSSFLN